MSAGPRHNKAEPVVEDKHLRPYGTRSLDPAISLVDRAREIETAGQSIKSHVHGKLALIQKQIQALQKEAETIMQQASLDLELHEVRCNFEKVVGQTMHLYDKQGRLYFSLLSPDDWQGQPPHPYQGSYIMQADRSFVRVDQNPDA